MSRGYYGSWGHPLLAVAVVKRFKQEPMYELSAGTKKVAVVDRYVAVSGGSTVLLYKQQKTFSAFA